MFRIRSPLLAMIIFIAIAIPASADLTGVTASPIKLPATLYDIALGPDGNLWGVTAKGNLGKVTPSGAYSEVTIWGTDQFNIPYAQHLTAGSDGNLWVVGFNGHVDRVTPGGTVTDFTVANAAVLTSSIVSRADGTVWFFNRLAPGPGTLGSPAWKMSRIDVLGNVNSYDLGISGDSLAGLVVGADGNLWFIDETKNQLVKFSTDTKSVAGTHAIPSPSNQNGDDQTIVAWDGNVWFTRGTSIDRATADGTITEFHVPSGGQPAGIAMSGDGNIWFTEPKSGNIGQLVLSSVTTGGTAAINESSGTLPGVYNDFLPLPPSFSGSFTPATALAALLATPCPPLTFLAKNSDTGADLRAVFPIPQCADIGVGLPVAKLRGTSTIRITSRIGNYGPNKANAFMIFATSSFSTSTIAAATFDNDPAARCDLNQPRPGAVECAIPLNAGEAHDLHVDFNNLGVSPSQFAIFTRVSGFSDLPDPDPSNNVQVRFVFLQSAAILPPANSGSGGGGGGGVANPSVPPGFKPCMVNAGVPGAVGPCFGPPGTTITLVMSQSVPGGPGSLTFKSVLFNGGPADVGPVPVSGSGSVYSATAPAKLCTGPFPHTWNVWLNDTGGGNQGLIGQFSMVNCP